MGNPRTATSLDQPIRVAMAETAIRVDTAATLNEVAAVLAENDIGAVPVVSREEMVGIVGERDLVRAIAEGADTSLDRAGEWMSFEVETLTADATIEQATAMMLEGGIRHLPVAEEGRIIGMVSIRDLLTVHAHLPSP
jgi:CBS domain-containing protein